MRTAIHSIGLYKPILVKILNFFDKINLHWNSFPYPKQEPASRDGGLASWLSCY